MAGYSGPASLLETAFALRIANASPAWSRPVSLRENAACLWISRPRLYLRAEMTELHYISRLLRSHELRLSKRFGQHLLVDEDILRGIAQTTGAAEGCRVVEIGAGVGNLTCLLALSGAEVTSIELDRRFEPVHREVFGAWGEVAGRVQFHYGDALNFDYRAASDAAREAGSKFLIAGNIPYQITSPLIMGILESGAEFDRMTLLMQREVGERLAAAPGSRRNGGISIKVQYFCEVEPAFDVSSAAFLPPPKVESQLVVFRRKPPVLEAGEQKRFFRLVDAAFSMRRKMLVNPVAARGIAPKADVEQALAAIGRNAKARAEDLGLEDFLGLFRAICDISRID